MKIEQVDNRRTRKAAFFVQRMIKNRDWEGYAHANARLCFFIDQTSSKIAKRCKLNDFCGVPASAAVVKPSFPNDILDEPTSVCGVRHFKNYFLTIHQLAKYEIL